MSSTAPKFACAIVVDTHGRFLLQLRDRKPTIRYPGKIGLFGGHREAGETTLQCVEREIYEEIGCQAPPEAFERVATFSGIEATGTYRVEIFALFDVRVSDLTIAEGSLLIVAPEDVFGLTDHLTPSAAFGLEVFLGRQEAQ